MTFLWAAHFQNAAFFALGIMPYISSSIIIQLLGAVVPYFQKLQKEGEAGRKKITQITRYGTVPVALMQAWGVSVQLKSRNVGGVSIMSPDVSPILVYNIMYCSDDCRNDIYDVARGTNY